MFKLVCLRLLFLFIATVFAIPVQNKDQNPRSHREQSQELDETIDWAGLEPIVELPISNPSAHQVTSSIPPKQTTASSLVIATSLDKNMLKRKRVKEAGERYRESLKLDPKKLQAYKEKRAASRKEREAKLSTAERSATRKRYRLNSRKRGKNPNSTVSRRNLINKVDSGTASEEQIKKLAKLRETDRISHQKRREREKQAKQQSNQQDSAL